MKQKILILLCALIATASAYSYDFSYFDGNKFLYFNKTSDNTCEITKKESGYYYQGKIDIPASVVNNGVTYTVTSIGENTFAYCSNLTSVNIPNTITSIGYMAFNACNNLTNIVLPNSLVSIGEGAFYNCGHLASINIPNSVTSVGKNAFYECQELTSIDIPNSVTSIGESAFSYCRGLLSIDIPNSLTSINSNVFEGCSGLISVTIPNSVISIGSWAFKACTSLESVNLPNSVVSIGFASFTNCIYLKSVYIPSSVTSIGKWAFDGCSSLESIKISNDNPGAITLGASAFLSVPTSTCVLSVPMGSKALYKAADQWKDFVNIEEFIEEVSITIGEPEMATLWIDYDAVIPNGVDVYYAESLIDNGGDAELRLVKIDGNILPAHTGVIVKGVNGTTHDFIVSDITGEAVESMLVGSSTDTTFGNDGYNYYKLTYGDSNHTPDSFGFYLANSDGTINAKPNKAYLKLSQTKNIAKVRISFNGDEPTGISTISVNNSSTTTGDIYNVYGQKVGPDYKGIVIINGKKVIKK